MDAVRVALLRDVLAGTEWLGATRRFGGTLRGAVTARGGGLLLVGTPAYEPWHLAAHLVDEAAWSGTPELAPTLIRHAARPQDPAHLSVGPARITTARRGETLLVVAPDEPPALLERLHTARRSGVTVLSLGAPDGELAALSHESLAVPECAELDLDTVQHLVSAAAGENGPPPGARRTFRDRLSHLTETLLAPPASPW
ncbi:hypothetical protein KUM39_04835 [Streptomyces sp. J2-1]|uniref:hypothetical protein n=1 Tax=Streptomyces corallincola TaxID=2851888 RepID=UPI001C3807D9|nr:hypothetical protein [Streptomyces corallincola]MBV2353693.1 hypothetical protein [Streptomyces corallincola]